MQQIYNLCFNHDSNIFVEMQLYNSVMCLVFLCEVTGDFIVIIKKKYIMFSKFIIKTQLVR